MAIFLTNEKNYMESVNSIKHIIIEEHKQNHFNNQASPQNYFVGSH